MKQVKSTALDKKSKHRNLFITLSLLLLTLLGVLIFVYASKDKTAYEDYDAVANYASNYYVDTYDYPMDWRSRINKLPETLPTEYAANGFELKPTGLGVFMVCREDDCISYNANDNPRYEEFVPVVQPNSICGREFTTSINGQIVITSDPTTSTLTVKNYDSNDTYTLSPNTAVYGNNNNCDVVSFSDIEAGDEISVYRNGSDVVAVKFRKR